MPGVVVLDVDGTLVDSNYQHVIAWGRAFRRHDVLVPLRDIHRGVGMGGDQLVAHLTDDETEERLGDAIREAEGDLYRELIGEVEPIEGARETIAELRRSGRIVVLSSSAKQEELDHYLDLLDAREIANAWTSAADVDATKPEPDLIQAALAKVDTTEGAVMVGDSVWDVRAAERAGVPAIGVLSGGFGEQELREAGARAIHDSVAELRPAHATA